MSLTDDERRIMVELEIERAEKITEQFNTLRERGDYNCFVDATEDEIVPLIEPLKALIAKIKMKIAE
jgi:uncharacterized protein (UPF0332 family)